MKIKTEITITIESDTDRGTHSVLIIRDGVREKKVCRSDKEVFDFIAAGVEESLQF